MVNRKRSTRISMNSGNSNRRKNGLGRFSRRQMRDQEFFPDEVQRKILGVAATSETPVSMSEVEGQCRDAGYNKKNIQQKNTLIRNIF